MHDLTPETLLAENVLYEFKMTHDSDGAGPTAGLLTVDLTNADTGELLDSRLARIPGPDIGPTALLNAFGVRTNFSTRDAPGSFAEVYFDDFEYSISGLPESDFQPGDANGDFSVDTQDIIQVLAENKFETGEPATFAQGDFNGDGVFNTADVIEMLSVGLFETGPYFEPSVNAESVPEPSSIVTLILGMVSLAVCGRRPRSPRRSSR